MRFTCAFVQVFHQVDELLPVNTDIPLDDVLACALLLYFGINTLRVSQGLRLDMLLRLLPVMFLLYQECTGGGAAAPLWRHKLRLCMLCFLFTFGMPLRGGWNHVRNRFCLFSCWLLPKKQCHAGCCRCWCKGGRRKGGSRRGQASLAGVLLTPCLCCCGACCFGV
jgi:hypothetical protein